jgi:uncharacterized protein with HEPN domain
MRQRSLSVPRRDWRLRVSDILAAAERIGRYTASLPEDVQAKAPQIPWRKMKGVRNIAAHDYFGIDLSTVWQTATVDVPALKLLVQALLAK